MDHITRFLGQTAACKGITKNEKLEQKEKNRQSNNQKKKNLCLKSFHEYTQRDSRQYYSSRTRKGCYGKGSTEE